MLKNKFGMTKILVLVLSVLMLVSLVACNKADGPSTDDMNAAIQAAIDAANAEQAAKEAALAASIAADKAAQEAKDAALAESIAKEKAENDAALKKAQEEAKAAADAAAAASKAAKEAADKAAKEAADAAAKAAKEAADKAAKEASEAAKKAQEEADKQASELAAALEAAKAEALKAQEEASKAAAEASKAIAEASKAAEEAAKASSQLAETTVPAETTVVAPGETTVVTPAVPVDKTEVLAAFSKLKTEYTYTKQAMYKADDYAELVLLFDKASLDLNNAASVEAATAVLETLKVDVLAIENVEMAAAEVAALVNALGDIETEVFTTQAEKIVEAQKAYEALTSKYATYFKYNTTDKVATADTHKIATKLGVNYADLEKADKKLDVLEDYIADNLNAKLEAIYKVDPRQKFRVEDLTGNATLKDNIDTAYYLYLVLSVVNGGDTAAADLAINWEYKLNDDGSIVRAEDDTTALPSAIQTADKATYAKGERIYDTKKPTDFFTAEDFIEVYALPVLDAEFETFVTKVVVDFKADLTHNLTADIKDDDKTEADETFKGIIKQLKVKGDYIVASYDVSYLIDDAAHAFEDALSGLSFVDDYKGNATLNDAKVDVYTKYAAAYIDAINSITVKSKAVAAEYYVDVEFDALITNLENQYSGDAYQNELQQSFYAKKKAQAVADKDAFLANVAAAPVYDYEAMNSLENRTAFSTTKVGVNVVPYLELAKYIKADRLEPTFYEYVNKAVVASINDNFVTKISGVSELGDYILALTTDLSVLRDRLDPTDNTTTTASLYLNNKGSVIDYLDGTGYKNEKIYTNTSKFTDMVAVVDKAIADIEALSADTTYVDTPTALKVPDNDKYGKSAKTKALYWINETSMNYTLKSVTDAEGNVDQAALEAALLAMCESNKAADEKWTSAGSITVNANDLPIQFIYTADEQKCAAAWAIYEAAFKSIHESIQGIRGDVATYQGKITGDADYKAVKANVASVPSLVSEVEAFANLYTGYISGANTLAKSMAASDKYGVNKFEGKAAVSQSLTATADHFSIQAVSDNGARYDDKGLTTEFQDLVDQFVDLFDGDAIVELYNYRNEVIAELKKVTATFLYGYTHQYDATTGAITSTTIKNNTNGWTYAPAYAGNVATGTINLAYNADKAAAAAAYEAEVAKLLDACINSINGVKLSSTNGVKDYMSKGDILKALGDSDKDSATGKHNTTLDTAKKIVDAYVVKFLGYNVAATMNELEKVSSLADPYLNGSKWGEYSNVGAEIFKAYKIYYLGDYTTLDKDTALSSGEGDNDQFTTETYTIQFKLDGVHQTGKDITVSVGVTAITRPTFEVADGFKIVWEDYASKLEDADAGDTVVINARKVAVYTITFVSDNGTTTVVTFDADTSIDDLKNKKAPKVPAKTNGLAADTTAADYVGEWVWPAGSAIADFNGKYVYTNYTRQYSVVFYKTATPAEGATKPEILKTVKVPEGMSINMLIAAKQEALYDAWEEANPSATPEQILAAEVKTAADAKAAFVPAVPTVANNTGVWNNEAAALAKVLGNDGDATTTDVTLVEVYPAYTPYYTVTFKSNEGETKFYYQNNGSGYAWLNLNNVADDKHIPAADIATTLLATIKEKVEKTHKVVWNAEELAKYTALNNLANVTAPADLTINAVYTQFATATYVDGNNISFLEYTIVTVDKKAEVRILTADVASGALTAAPDAPAGKVWTIDLMKQTEIKDLTIIAIDAPATTTTPATPAPSAN